MSSQQDTKQGPANDDFDKHRFLVPLCLERRRWSTSDDCDPSSLSRFRKRRTLQSRLPGKDEERGMGCTSNRFSGLPGNNHQQADGGSLQKPGRSTGVLPLPGTGILTGGIAAGSQSQPPSLFGTARMRKGLQKQHLGMKAKPSGVSSDSKGPPGRRFSKSPPSQVPSDAVSGPGRISLDGAGHKGKLPDVLAKQARRRTFHVGESSAQDKAPTCSDASEAPASATGLSVVIPKGVAEGQQSSALGELSPSSEDTDCSPVDKPVSSWGNVIRTGLIDNFDDRPKQPEFIWYQRGLKKARFSTLLKLRGRFDAMAPDENGNVSYEKLPGMAHILNAIMTRDVLKMKIKLSRRSTSCAGRIDMVEEEEREIRLSQNLFNFTDMLRFNFFSCDYEDILEMAKSVAPERLAFEKLTRRQVVKATRLFKDMDTEGTGRLTYEKLESGMHRNYRQCNVYSLIKTMNEAVLEKLYLGGTIGIEEFVMWYADSLAGNATIWKPKPLDGDSPKKLTDPSDAFSSYLCEGFEERKRLETVNIVHVTRDLQSRLSSY